MDAKKVFLLVGVIALVAGAGFVIVKRMKLTPSKNNDSTVGNTPINDKNKVDTSDVEGKAVKCDGKDAIYIIEGGKKKWVTTLDKYNDLGSPEVTVISCSKIDAIQDGEKM